MRVKFQDKRLYLYIKDEILLFILFTLLIDLGSAVSFPCSNCQLPSCPSTFSTIQLGSSVNGSFTLPVVGQVGNCSVDGGAWHRWIPLPADVGQRVSVSTCLSSFPSINIGINLYISTDAGQSCSLLCDAADFISPVCQARAFVWTPPSANVQYFIHVFDNQPRNETIANYALTLVRDSCAAFPEPTAIEVNSTTLVSSIDSPLMGYAVCQRFHHGYMRSLIWKSNMQVRMSINVCPSRDIERSYAVVYRYPTNSNCSSCSCFECVRLTFSVLPYCNFAGVIAPFVSEMDTTYIFQIIFIESPSEVVNEFSVRLQVGDPTPDLFGAAPASPTATQETNGSGSTMTNEQRNTATIAAAVAVPIIVFIAAVAIAVILLRRKKKTQKHQHIATTQMDDLDRAPLPSSLKYMQVLGEGASGIVRLAVFHGEFVAVKELRNVANMIKLQELRAEATIMSTIKRTRNVVQIVELLDSAEEPPALVMEFCPRGSLSSFLKSRRAAGNTPETLLTPQEMFKFAYGTAEGMTMLAAANIVHGDLAARNILLDEHLIPKVSDFGLAVSTQYERDIQQEKKSDDSRLGPIKWQAPEVLSQGQSAFSEASDVWAYGVTLIEIATGREPFHAYPQNLLQLMADVCDNGYDPLKHLERYEKDVARKLPDWLVQIATLCFKQNAADRPGFRELRYHLGRAAHKLKGEYFDELDAIDSLLAGGAYSSVPTPLQPVTVTKQQETSEQSQGKAEAKIISGMQLDVSNLVKLNKLGAGAFGDVFLGRVQDRYVAIKEIFVSASTDDVLREAEIMMRIPSARNVVAVYGVHSQGSTLSIVMEFAPRGSLDNIIRGNSGSSITEGQQFRWAVGIARGMACLAAANVVHRDLAARNVLLDSSLEPKISDFGLARSVLDPTQESFTKTDIGPIRWFAPECYELKYSEKSDVWAYGCTLVEIATGGLLPFDGLSVMDVANAVTVKSMTPLHYMDATIIPSWMQKIMQKCFEFKASARPSFEEIVTELEGVATSISEIREAEEEIQKRRNRRATAFSPPEASQYIQSSNEHIL